MLHLLNYLICSILKDKEDVVYVAMKQRSKFEGWLKLELAYKLSKYCKDVHMEHSKNGQFVDIYADGSLIELKTPNTNYRADAVDKKTRPITNNIQSIVKDIQKLKNLANSTGGKYVAFVIFPIDNAGAYKEHLDKIRGHCMDVVEKELDVSDIPVLVCTASCK